MCRSASQPRQAKQATGNELVELSLRPKLNSTTEKPPHLSIIETIHMAYEPQSDDWS